jgi:spore coat protein U-like protein
MKKLTIVFFFVLLCGLRLGAQTQSSCQLQQISNVNFFTYSSYAIQSTGSISVNCTSGVAYSIGISAGGTSSATTTNRMMNCSGCTPSTLGYQLFSNASYTTNWGNNIGSDTVAETGTGSSQTITVYGQIPALEAFYASSNGSNYNDSVTVTIYCSACTSGISANNQGLTVHLQQTAVGCGITATDLNFGNYTGAQSTAATTISVGCSSGTSYNVGLSAGTATGATVTNRSMTLTGGSTLLKYELLRGSYTGSNWGDSKAANWASGSGTGLVQNLTVYGVIPAGQSVTQGTYTDTITATLTY